LIVVAEDTRTAPENPLGANVFELFHGFQELLISFEIHDHDDSISGTRRPHPSCIDRAVNRKVDPS
jgi:hypothetical protein